MFIKKGRRPNVRCVIAQWMENVVTAIRKIPYILVVLLLAILGSWLFTESCLRSEAAGVLCLSEATPFVEKLRPLFPIFGTTPRQLYIQEITWAVAFFGFVAFVSLLRRRFRAAFFWLIVTLPIIGEGYALQSNLNLTLLCHLSAVALLILFWFASRTEDAKVAVESSPYRGWELGAFTFLIVGLLFLRFYGLNRIPAGWDTETCIYRSIVGTWQRIWAHEAGWHPQASCGLTWLVMNKLLGHYDEPDIYYLIHRFLGCFLSVLKVSVLFLFLRSQFGRFPAFFGAALLAFGPPEEWWARVPNYHHFPGLVTVLIVWTTIRAMQSPTWGNFLFLSAVSAVSRFVYPSGLFMVMVPISFFGSLLVFQWSQWKPHFWKISSLLLGISVWMIWFSFAHSTFEGHWRWMPPLVVPSHSELPPSLFAKFRHIVVENGSDLLSALFYTQVNKTHWTFPQTPQPWRSVPSVVAILTILAIARMIGRRRDKISWLLMITAFFAAFPGLTTSVADRRIGCIFVILIIVAAREAGWLFDYMRGTMSAAVVRPLQVIVPIAVGGYLAAASATNFFFTTPGVPRQVALGKVFRENVRANELLIDLTGQLNCDLFYSISREMRTHGCNAGFVSSNYKGEFQPTLLIENPRFDPSNWWYGATDFSQCTDWPTRQWKGVTFMITDTGSKDTTAKWLDLLKQRFPQGTLELKEVSYMPYSKEPLYIYRTAL